MAAHRVHLRHDGHVEAGIGLRDGDRRAQTRAAAADQHDVMRRRHVRSPALFGGEQLVDQHAPVVADHRWLTVPSWYSCWMLRQPHA